MERVDERPYGKGEWFFYVVLLPVLFAAGLLGIVLTFLGVDVPGALWRGANAVPGLGYLVPDPPGSSGAKDAEHPAGNAAAEADRSVLQAQLQAKDAEIRTLRERLAERDREIESLNQKIASLQQELRGKRLTDEEREARLKEMAQLYAGMSPTKAARILEAMTREEAALVLARMRPETRARVLAQMRPQRAAELSMRLANETPAEDPDIAALQARIAELERQLDAAERRAASSVQEVAASLARMSPKEAAGVVRELTRQQPNHAVAVLAAMEAGARGAIFDQLAKEHPALVARLTRLLLNAAPQAAQR
ncbi:MAG TPA: hypothetical protein VIK75_06165 [Calditerricola sp.]